MGDIIKGDDLRIEVGESGSEKKIYASTGCEFGGSSDFLEAIHKDNTGKWKEYEPDKLSASLSCESLFVMSEASSASVHDMWQYMADGTVVNFKFTTGEVGDVEYSGTCFVKDVKMNAPAGDNATASVEFQITGVVTQSTIS